MLPVPPEIAVTLPLAGKKHLLPQAEWGTVSSDSGGLPWTEEAAALTILVASLREAGVKETEFIEPVPPYRIVAATLTDTNATLSLMTHWEELRTWQGTPHLVVSIRATRLPKIPEEPRGNVTVEGEPNE